MCVYYLFAWILTFGEAVSMMDLIDEWQMAELKTLAINGMHLFVQQFDWPAVSDVIHSRCLETEVSS